MNGRSLSGLAMACLLVAGCAATGGNSAPTASEQSSPASAEPGRAQATGAGSAAATAKPPTADPASLRRIREGVAQMLERNLAYRGIPDGGAPKGAHPGPHPVE
jgi:hypothetical protein